MATEEENQSPRISKYPSKQSVTVENGGNVDNIISPRFRSVAAMAGWDEEALLLASLVVEDTPERESKHKKRDSSQFKSPPTSSRRKRRAPRRSPASIPVVVLNLDGEETATEENDTKKMEPEIDVIEENKREGADAISTKASADSCSDSALPCIDRLRQELSCAICLEICFEPSTTPCGHSFCKKCLRSAADKCGKKCPKCRQLISNGKSCIVNTVLWNTIQLLFPQEVEARKVAIAINSREAERQSPEKGTCNTGIPNLMGRDVSVRRRRGVPCQAQDAALAFRLQREEFMEAFRGTPPRSSLSSARANLRAMASRAINLRIRGRPM
ncbi:hypothetical protein HHK36_015718 [Tetracentron sinense]|uniref:RING-type E3 ubiquitin transferase n=1 Tax=Tetracentron sinense TaxID=13715 RepID=A0A834ZC97_TETSI|nr:hypothetical protein HHK36_015718 [Tetracentron sinense]